MGVIDGQAVSASVTNSAFLNKNQSDAMPFDLAIQAGLNFPKSVISTSGAINALDSSKVNVKLTGSSVILNGAVAGTDGDILIVLNATGSNITVNSLSGSASSANQFQLNASTATIATNQSAFFQYETTSAKWYQIGSSASGAGGGSKNYFSLSNGNPTFSSGQVTPWSACTLTLSSGIPSGAPTLTATQMALAVTSTNPLAVSSSAYNAQLTKSASNAQGQGFISGAMTIDREDTAKVLYGSFSYEVVSGTIDLSGSSTQSLEIWIYNTVSGAWTQPAGYRGMNQSSGQGKVIFNFQTDGSTANNSYKIAVITAQTSASAYVVNFCDFSIGPASIVTGAVITDWQSYTPTLTNITIGNGTIEGRWRRVGDSAQYQIGMISGSTTTYGAGSLIFGLFSGHVMDLSKIPLSGPISNSLGQAGILRAGTARMVGNISQAGSTAVGVNAPAGGTPTNVAVGADVVDNNSPYTWAGAGDTFALEFMVPIIGWSSTVQVSSDTDTRVVDFSGTKSSTQAVTGNATDITFTTSKDSHGAWNGSQYIVPVSGDYIVSIAIGDAGSTTWLASAYVDGVLSRALGESYAGGWASGSTIIPNLKAGQSISIRVSSSTTIQAVSYQNLSISRISGPSVIASTETVALDYRTTAGQSIPNNVLTSIVWGTKTYDTHGIMNTSTGTITTPISGKYMISSAYCFGNYAWTAGTQASLSVIKNGSYYGILSRGNETNATTTKYDSGRGSMLVQCNAGDTIQIQVVHTFGSAINLQADTNLNYVTMSRVGN